MPPPRTSFKPLELAPEWLTESPITFDDLRCTTYPPTLWRVSLPPSPAAPRSRNSKVQRRRDSVASASSSSSSSSSSSADIVELSKAGSPQRCQDHPRVVSTHLAPEDASSFLFYHDDENDEDERDGLHIGRWAPEREHEDDEATLNDQGPGPEILAVDEEDPSPIDPFFKPKSQPHSVAPSPALLSLPLPAPAPSPAPESEQEYAHSRGSSFDCASPWFMHVSAGALAALDDQLLQAPVDAFADLCYARAVQLPCASSSSDAGAVEAVPYSWRRFSRLRPLSPFSDIHEAEEEEGGRELEEEEGEESTDGSDTDGDDEVVSPDGDWPGQGAMTRPRIYSPTPHAHRDAHPPAHPRHYAHESDGSIQFRSQAQTLSMSPTALASTTIPTTASKPLPLTPQPSPSPSPPPDAFYDLGELRGAAASPPPLFLPSPAVSQAQLALLFGAQTPPKPSESVHFFPGSGAPVSGSGSGSGKGWSRRGVQALRISTNTNANGNSIGGGGSGGSTPATATATNTHAGGGGGWFQRGLRAIRA